MTLGLSELKVQIGTHDINQKPPESLAGITTKIYSDRTTRQSHGEVRLGSAKQAIVIYNQPICIIRSGRPFCHVNVDEFNVIGTDTFWSLPKFADGLEDKVACIPLNMSQPVPRARGDVVLAETAVLVGPIDIKARRCNLEEEVSLHDSISALWAFR